MNREDILEYALGKYGGKPDYPWGKLPSYAVLRHGDNGKWYALIANVDRGKLEIAGDGAVDILNVKCDPELSSILKRENAIIPAYHMNKEHWVTVILDGSVSDVDIVNFIDMSFELTK